MLDTKRYSAPHARYPSDFFLQVAAANRPRPTNLPRVVLEIIERLRHWIRTH